MLRFGSFLKMASQTNFTLFKDKLWQVCGNKVPVCCPIKEHLQVVHHIEPPPEDRNFNCRLCHFQV